MTCALPGAGARRGGSLHHHRDLWPPCNGAWEHWRSRRRTSLSRTRRIPRDEARIWRMAAWLSACRRRSSCWSCGFRALFGGNRAEVLPSTGPRRAACTLPPSCVMLAAQVIYNVIVLPLRPPDDGGGRAAAHRAAAVRRFLAVRPCHRVGAPLSEELLFRGFLLSALAQSRLGYSGARAAHDARLDGASCRLLRLGLIEVFLAGLLFSWLLWRTGNLWVPIACHAFYNSRIVLSRDRGRSTGVRRGSDGNQAKNEPWSSISI